MSDVLEQARKSDRESAYTNSKAKRRGYERPSLELPGALVMGQVPLAALAQVHLAGGRGGKTVKRAPRGQREAEFLSYLEEHPGAKASEAAKSMGVAPNQVYGLARRLHKAGRVSKRRGGGYALRASATKS